MRKAWRREHLDTIHPPSGGDDPAHDRDHGGGRHRLLSLAGVAPAPGRLPDHLGTRATPRREPGGGRHHSRDAARATSRPDRRRDRDDLVVKRRLGAHQPAVRPRSRHQRRRARRAGGHQCRSRRPADEPAVEPDLSQGQPGGRAHSDPGLDLRHPPAG